MSDRTKSLKKLLMTTWPKGKELRGLYGAKPAEKVFDLILASGYVTPQIADKKKKDHEVLNVVDIFIDLELANCGRTMRHIHQGAGYKLYHGQYAAIIAANTMPEANYGGLATDTHARKAAKWVCNASLTTSGNLGEINATEALINMAIALRVPMNQMSGLDAINGYLIQGGGVTTGRGPVPLPMPSPLPSSPGGRAMLEAAVGFISGRTPGGPHCAWADLGCYLMGATIGCHGFSDANGRTGRVLYSICQVQGGGFTGLTVAGEKLIHGLP